MKPTFLSRVWLCFILEAKLNDFLKKECSAFKNNSFRSDQMSLLALSCHIFMNVPDNLKNFLLYKQEQISHPRWVTMANGYLRLLLFDIIPFSHDEPLKLSRIAFFVVSVNASLLIMNHFKAEHR